MGGSTAYTCHFQRLSQPGITALVLAIALIAFAAFSFQSFTGNSLSPLFPAFGKTSSSRNSSLVMVEEQGTGANSTSSKGKERNLDNAPEISSIGKDIRWKRGSKPGDSGVNMGTSISSSGKKETRTNQTFSTTSSEGKERNLDNAPSPSPSFVTYPEGSSIGKDTQWKQGNKSSDSGVNMGTSISSSGKKETRTNQTFSTTSSEGKERNLDNTPSPSPSFVTYPESSSIGKDTRWKQGNKSSDSGVSISSSGKKETRTNQTIATSEVRQPLQSAVANPNCAIAEDLLREKKRNKSEVTIAEMDQILLKNRGSSCSKRPQWPSPTDRQILKAKKQILKAPIVQNDSELYAPAFRNLSTFKRSYELMEKVLKVYVYKEGDAPIFHHPPLIGIYASEGWFMKHMEGSRRFIVDDPSKAHLFYIPFSSSILRSQLFNTKRRPVDYLKTYMGTIVGKYPFWNRTGGADHFLAACYDYAPSETAQAMGGSIRALCNADVTVGFELGKDVSLPETNIPRADPLWGLGGRPVRKRPLLAFFSGQMNGYLRPLLVQQWENRDPGMKLFGEGERKNGEVYGQYMRSSKYCICPRGSEVNSPRVVEAIFYECVPVIISDNFVPPFFEVLNWAAFSVVVAERDLPRLKEVLTAIPKKRYLALQAGVKGVQRHFLWHKQPVKYDLFHMILHSVWVNRVYNI